MINLLIEKIHAETTLGSILNSFNGASPTKGLMDFLNFLTGTPAKSGTLGHPDTAASPGILTLALDFAGMLAVIMVLYGAFLYVTAYGDDTKAKKAKDTIFWSIIGLVLMSFAYAIVLTMQARALPAISP